MNLGPLASMTRPIRSLATLFAVVFAATLLVLAAAPAHASAPDVDPADPAAVAEAGAKSDDKASVVPTVAQAWAPVIATIIVFAIVLVFMHHAVWPKIMKGLDERAAKIREEIESAEAARQQAKDALEMYEQNLAEAQAEAKKMLEQTKAQQSQLAAELRAKADAEVSALKDKALKDIETAKKAAVVEVYQDASQLAAAMAGKILRREISAEDQQSLVEESLREFQAASN